MNAWIRLRPALVELALFWSGYLVGGIAILGVVALGLGGSEGGQARLLGFVWGPLITAIAALVYRWLSRAVQPDDQRVDPAFLRAQSPSLRPLWVAAYVAGGIAAALVGSYVIGELVALTGYKVEEQKAILDIVASAKERGAYFDLVVLGTAAVVLAPLSEEWLFRGLFFRRLLQVSGRPEAYVLSAICFAIIHTNLAGFIIYLWLGLCFAFTLYRTGKLWAAVLVHAGNNAFAFTLLVIG